MHVRQVPTRRAPTFPCFATCRRTCGCCCCRCSPLPVHTCTRVCMRDPCCKFVTHTPTTHSVCLKHACVFESCTGPSSSVGTTAVHGLEAVAECMTSLAALVRLRVHHAPLATHLDHRQHALVDLHEIDVCMFNCLVHVRLHVACKADSGLALRGCVAFWPQHHQSARLSPLALTFAHGALSRNFSSFVPVLPANGLECSPEGRSAVFPILHTCVAWGWQNVTESVI